jgi:hypothetical protein
LLRTHPVATRRSLWHAGGFDPAEEGRWLLTAAGVDVKGLARAAERARARGEPVLLLATAFALSFLLEALGAARLPLPEGSVVMITGGFKGYQSALDPDALASRACTALAIPPRRLVSEYGMTELGSQLYDEGHRPGHAPVFREPPWLRVTPLDPLTLEPVDEGEEGLACFTDLCNVDSALRVVTQDLVRRRAGGIVLVGRRRGARLRGCSLSASALEGVRLRPRVSGRRSGLPRMNGLSAYCCCRLGAL